MQYKISTIRGTKIPRLGFFADSETAAILLKDLLFGLMPHYISTPPTMTSITSRKFVVVVDLPSDKELEESINIVQNLVARWCSDNNIHFTPYE